MRRSKLALNGALSVMLVTVAFGVPLASAVSSSAPTPNGTYANNADARVGQTSVQITVNPTGSRVRTLLTCYEKKGVQVQADNGAYSYPLHHGAFSFDKKYEVDKLIPDDGDTVDETGHGTVLLTGRFTNGKFVGKVQIPFIGFTGEHLGGGCRKVSYVASLNPDG